MDSKGVMYEGVINDNGHYYLLNPNHNGTYGMMISGTSTYSYNGVQLQLETQHNGFFGEIKNTDVIANLGLKVTNVNTTGKPCLYTSNFGGNGNQEVEEEEDSDTATVSGEKTQRYAEDEAIPGHIYRMYVSNTNFRTFLGLELQQIGDNVFCMPDMGDDFLYWQNGAGVKLNAGETYVMKNRNKTYDTAFVTIFEKTDTMTYHYYTVKGSKLTFYGMQVCEGNPEDNPTLPLPANAKQTIWHGIDPCGLQHSLPYMCEDSSEAYNKHRTLLYVEVE